MTFAFIIAVVCLIIVGYTHYNNNVGNVSPTLVAILLFIAFILFVIGLGMYLYERCPSFPKNKMIPLCMDIY